LGSQPGDLGPGLVIGTPIAPNATGAVLATKATDAALMGLIPTAMSMTAVDRDRGAEPGERLEQRPRSRTR